MKPAGMGLRGHREQAAWFGLREHSHAQLVEDEGPQFSVDLTVLISNAELDRFIAEVRARPLAEGELRAVAEGSTSL